MGVGVPGSGKTTVLKEFSSRYGYSYISPDDIRLEITGNAADQTKNSEVWDEAYVRTKNELQSGKTVVFDATFVNPKQRRDFINFAKENGAEKVQGVFLDIPIEIAKERNENRERIVPEYAMDRMNESLRKFPPQIEDGFDGLFSLNEMGDLTDAEINYENNVISREFGRLV